MLGPLLCPLCPLSVVPESCLCCGNQSRAWAEIMDHWCHTLIKDSGVKLQGGDQTSSILGPSANGMSKSTAGLQAEKAHCAKAREREIKG